MVKLDENELNQRVICSWMPPPKVDELYSVGWDTFDWALQERFEGSIPTLATIRARYVHLWQQQWGDKPQIGPEYWRGPRAAVGFGTKLYKFLLKYGCLQPFDRYPLFLGRGEIWCHSALVEQSKSRYHPQHAFAVDLRVIQPKLMYVPDYRALARWMTMQFRSEPKIGLLHVPLVFGKEWSEMELDLELVKKWLNSIMEQADYVPTYPVAGSHCRTCPAPCTEVFCGPNDHYRKERVSEVSGV